MYIYVISSRKSGGMLGNRHYRTLYGAVSAAKRLAVVRSDKLEICAATEEVCWPTIAKITPKGRMSMVQKTGPNIDNRSKI